MSVHVRLVEEDVERLEPVLGFVETRRARLLAEALGAVDLDLGRAPLGRELHLGVAFFVLRSFFADDHDKRLAAPREDGVRALESAAGDRWWGK